MIRGGNLGKAFLRVRVLVGIIYLIGVTIFLALVAWRFPIKTGKRPKRHSISRRQVK